MLKKVNLAYQKVKDRVDRICSRAYETGVPVLIDAEESWIQNPVDDMAYAMMKKYNGSKAIVFNTYQMYRADMLKNLRPRVFRRSTGVSAHRGRPTRMGTSRGQREGARPACRPAMNRVR